MSECPIRFKDVTKAQLEESLKIKSSVIISSYYMGCIAVTVSIKVTEVIDHGENVSFKADCRTPDGKEWEFCGYITPSKNEGVMTASLKKL
jgi:hypothetical protein